RLDDRFHLLTGGSRTAVPRQQTLRAAIDWSYSLLSEAERVLLRQLSVFAGGWTLEAAEQVCSEQSTVNSEPSIIGSKASLLLTVHRSPFTDILDLLTRLVDKSLVVVYQHGQAARYRLLETIRQYGQEKLREPSAIANREAEGLLERH